MLTYNMVLAAAAQAGDSLAAEQWFNKMTKELLDSRSRIQLIKEGL